MTKIQRTLIRSLGLANILVYSAVVLVAWSSSATSMSVDPVVPTSASPLPSVDSVVPISALLPPTAKRANPRPTFPLRPTVTVMAPPSRPTLTSTPLPTPTPTFVPLLAPTPAAPSIASAFGHNPVPLLDLPPEVVNVVLLGSDQRVKGSSWRTDSIILATVNSSTKTIGLLSIPRDLWVYIPTYGYERINTADFRGEYSGYDKGNTTLIKQTIEYNLGIPVHYYIRVDFQGFMRLIDALGGVTVYVDCPIEDWFPDPDSPTGLTQLYLPPGVHHLDGKMALYFSRSRLNTNDYDRSRRQQKVLRGLWEQALQLDILPKIPRLWETLSDTVQTDLSLEQIMALAYLGTQLKPGHIRSRFIDWRVTRSWLTPQGASVLLPDPQKISQTVAELLAPLDETLDWLEKEGARIEIQNGTNIPNLAELAAARLRWHGFRVTRVGPADKTDYLITTVRDYSGKGYTLSQLCEALSIPPANIQQQFDPQNPIDIRVILGPDFRPCSR